MGPLATVDFLGKLVRLTGAATDQEHIPVILIGDPRILDRTEAVAEGKFDEVTQALVDRFTKLELAGVDAVAIPCNTAHCWYDAITAQSKLPIIHIADASVAALQPPAAENRNVTLWGTPAALAGGFYEPRLAAAGYHYVTTPDDIIRNSVMPAIRSVKASRMQDARAHLLPAIAFAEQSGARQVILGCSELPMAFEDLDQARLSYVDTNEALAAACVAWWRTGDIQPQGRAAGEHVSRRVRREASYEEG
jgi:aspartate racemase